MAQLVVPNDEEVAPPGLAFFLKLPNEILHQINSYLDPVCLAVLSVTCRVCRLRADPMIPFILNIADLIYRRSVRDSKTPPVFVVLPSIAMPMLQRPIFQTLAEKDRYMSYVESL